MLSVRVPMRNATACGDSGILAQLTRPWRPWSGEAFVSFQWADESYITE
jgi:hypothetical protein